jgi:hypothetical protein
METDTFVRDSWDGFAPFAEEELEAERGIYESLERDIASSWEEECKKYEETASVEIDGKTVERPRRNYINREARVEDPSLFPYHSACYALLDAYDNLYESLDQEPVPKDAVPTFCYPPPPHYPAVPRVSDEVQGFLPCSVRAIAAGVLQLNQSEGRANSENMLTQLVEHALMVLWMDIERGDDRGSLQHYLQVSENGFDFANNFFRNQIQYGPVVSGTFAVSSYDQRNDTNRRYNKQQAFPTDVVNSREPLLKLFKHALSEIQRDHVLADVVAARLLTEGHLECVDTFRRMLTILSTEVVSCSLPCEEPGDHVCNSWERFLGTMKTTVGSAMFRLTENHGLAVSGFVRYILSREFGHLMTDSGHSLGEKMKNQLKRNLVVRREEYDEGELPESAASDHVQVILGIIINGLRWRACMERKHIRRIMKDGADAESEETICSALRSYNVCMSALVSISESVTTLLPPLERFYPIPSLLVFSLTVSLIDGDTEHYTPVSYIGEDFHQHERLSTPFRFADCVKDASQRQREAHFPATDFASRRDALLYRCKQILYGRPPEEMRVIVRNFFVCDLVHLQDSCVGYGDFLLWCRYEVDALDPVLATHEFNYHVDDDEEEDEDDEEEEDSPWDEDETGKVLTQKELRDRFDFTLLSLQCAWNEPWTPESHPSFQPDFRTAVHQVALCLHSKGLPRELHGHIVQYFSREFWPDERRECRQYDCMVEQVRRQEECRDTGDVYVRPPVEFCDCHVATYCSRGPCRGLDWKDGHKWLCNRPPCRRPTAEDVRFCKAIQNNEPYTEEGVVPQAGGKDEIEWEAAEGDEDDDDDWESVESDEEMDEPTDSTPNVTSAIVDYFKKHSKA